MVWRRLTESLQFKSWHFKWVPYILTEELRQNRIDGARTLLDALEAQQRIGFRDIATGDESWIHLHISPNSFWIGAEETASTRPRTTIALTNAMPPVLWAIRGVELLNCLPHGVSFNGAYFDENILQPMASELHAGEKKSIARGHCSIWIMHDRTHRNGIWLEWKNYASNALLIRLLALISHHQTSFSLDGSKASSLLDRLAISVSFLNSSTRF
jgi:hypothetical protein